MPKLAIDKHKSAVVFANICCVLNLLIRKIFTRIDLNNQFKGNQRRIRLPDFSPLIPNSMKKEIQNKYKKLIKIGGVLISKCKKYISKHIVVKMHNTIHINTPSNFFSQDSNLKSCCIMRLFRISN
jgi:hypothetical protein